jgi:diguanylate cyclase (GGDEF)-like protein
LADEKLSGEHSELIKSNILLERLVNMDSLTGIYNRRYLDEQLRIQWSIAKRQKQMLTIFMIDIDHFKQYNDGYGHQAGDDALRRVAKALSNSFLKSTDFVARYGGEEFTILTIGGDPSLIAAYADLVVKKVSDLRIRHSGPDKKILTISLGFSSCWPDQEQDYSDIIKQADEALYEAKGGGRNKSVNYTKPST